MKDVNFYDYYTPTEKQAEFHVCQQKYKLIGGAMGGGKSRAGCAEAIQQCLDIEGNRFAILRKNLTVLKRTTLVTFFEVCPPDIIANYNKSELTVTLKNGSVILFLECDDSKDPTFEKLKSLEIGGFFIDEGSEVAEEAFTVLCSRLRWEPAKGWYNGFVSSNPEECWVKKRFVDQRLPGHAFIRFLPSDNPFLPEGYIDDLLGVFSEEQKRKYVYGDWETTSDPSKVIPYADLKNVLASEEEVLEAARSAVDLDKIIVADIAELGDDHSAVIKFRGPFAYHFTKYSKKTITEVSNFILQDFRDEFDVIPGNSGCDAVGVGAGVWSNVYSAGFHWRRLMAGSSPSSQWPKSNGIHKSLFNFRNARAQWWWKLRTDIMDLDSGILIPNRPDLVSELVATKYRIVSEKTIELEKKDNVKKRLGRSPDEADAFVMGNFIRNVQPDEGYSGAEASWDDQYDNEDDAYENSETTLISTISM